MQNTFYCILRFSVYSEQANSCRIAYFCEVYIDLRSVIHVHSTVLRSVAGIRWLSARFHIVIFLCYSISRANSTISIDCVFVFQIAFCDVAYRNIVQSGRKVSLLIKQMEIVTLRKMFLMIGVNRSPIFTEISQFFLLPFSWANWI